MIKIFNLLFTFKIQEFFFHCQRPQLKTNSGVDVMITIFCDFRQFSAKNGGFLKKQCYHKIFEYIIWLCFEKKNPIFRRFFWAKIFLKNHNIGPRFRALFVGQSFVSSRKSGNRSRLQTNSNQRIFDDLEGPFRFLWVRQVSFRCLDFEY
jgi:hypothetical protein